jgi:pyochelin biosynthesis protein PchC
VTGPADPADDSADAPQRWLRCFRPRPEAEVRLVCFPHAGGAASAFYSWSARFGPRIEVLAVQYPGRQDRHREPPVKDLGELADRAAAAVRATVGEGGYAFFGHSFGATLAFEVARRLGSEHGPDLVVVSGRRAPSVTRPETGHLLDDRALAGRLAELSGTDPRLLADPEALALFLPVVRADLRALETHGFPPGTVIDAPILTLTGDCDPWTTVPEAAAWRGHTAGRFELRVFPGGHFFLTDHAAEITDLVAGALATGAFAPGALTPGAAGAGPDPAPRHWAGPALSSASESL